MSKGKDSLRPVDEIIACVRKAVGTGPRTLQVPRILDSDRERVMAATIAESRSVQTFEAEVGIMTGAEYVVAVSSGTAGLQLALMAAGIPLGSEVLVPSLTFSASANAILHAGYVPHLVDINQATLGVHPFKLRQHLGNEELFRRDDKEYLINIATGRRVSAIMPVHLLGQPCDIEAIRNMAAYYRLIVVEDAAEALGSYTATGKHCGTIGTLGVLSFNYNKIATTQGGGAVLTEDKDKAQYVRHLATNAKLEHPYLWESDTVGFNFRMPQMCAALGIGQLRRLKATVEEKRKVRQRYVSAFEETNHAKVFEGKPDNCWLNAILLDSRVMDKRDEIIEKLLSEGYEARAMFTPLHKQAPYKLMPRQATLTTCEDIFRRAICLPSTVPEN